MGLRPVPGIHWACPQFPRWLKHAGRAENSCVPPYKPPLHAGPLLRDENGSNDFSHRKRLGVVHMCVGVLKGGSRWKCLICICTSGTPRSQGTWGPPSFKGLGSLREMAEGFQGKVVRS